MSTQAATNTIEEVFPYLRVRGAKDAIKFYQDAFGAVETFRMEESGGRIGHAQMTFGPMTVMLSDEHPEHGILSPLAFGGTGSSLHLHVANVDEMASRAVALGATLIMAPQDQFYGERTAKILDPFGHEWMLGQHIEDVAPDEMQRRYEAMCGKSE
jgi:PhnB protein